MESRPPLGLTGRGAAERDVPVGEEARLFAGRAQVQLGVGEELARGVGVLALDDVDVVRPDARFLVGVARGERRRRSDVDVVDPRERCRLAEHAARQMGTEAGRGELHAAARTVVPLQHDRGRALVG